MGKELSEILKDGTLVDNQSYQIKEDKGVVLSNQRLGDIPLGLTNENDIWSFLNNTYETINEILSDKKQKNALVLFNNKEYEHNSDDDFIKITGTNCHNFNLATGNIVGYIKEGNYGLKISSRFGDAFLKEIIADADGFIEIEEHGGDDSSNGYEWLLIYLWKIKLKKAYRLGLPKIYKSHNDVLYKVKGSVDPIDYYLNRSLGKYECNYREHSYNTPAVRLIKEAIQKVRGHSFTHDLHTIKQVFTTATNGERIRLSRLKDVKHFTNPFYTDYNPVIDLSKMILRDEFIDFGNESNTNAFLFDVSMLFEYFIRKILIRNNFVFDEQKKEIDKCALDGSPRRIKPDIVIKSDDGVSIFDVKYKNYNFWKGVKREDLFQLHTYIGQYGNDATTIKQAGFIYPISKKKWESEKEAFNGKSFITQEIKMMDRVVPFSVFFFIVPESCDDAKEYHSRFQKSITTFMNEFETLFIDPVSLTTSSA